MLKSELDNIESILMNLEGMGYPFPQFEFYKVNKQLQILGRGGSSVVYEIIEKEHPEIHYALKVIGGEGQAVDSIAFWNNFRLQKILCDTSQHIVKVLAARELQVKVDEHGHVRQVWDVAEERENTEVFFFQFILMERLEEIIKKDKFANITLKNFSLATEESVISFALQIGKAIMLAHENCVLHRDIKLENIFWDNKEECYKLGDFGMSKYVENGSAQTIVYTDGYGAPEITRKVNDSYDATADIYSFGIVLYLVLNDLKFPGSEGYYVNPVQYEPEFTFPAPFHASEGMAHLIRKMCSYRKEERYQTMSDVLEGLNYLRNKGNLTEEDINFVDGETETYKEENQAQTRAEDIRTDGKRLVEEYSERKKTRAGRKQIEKENNEAYVESSIRYFVLFSILFLLLFIGLQRETSFISCWRFWIFPIAMFVEGILEQMKEFHIVFGIFTIGIGLYSIWGVGLTIPHVFLIGCMLFNIPVLTLAGATGTGLWMLLEIMGEITWLRSIATQSWIVLVVFLLALHGILKLQIEHGTITYFSARVGSFLYDKLAIGMIIAGIIVLFLQYSERIVIPEVVNQVHLIRTGVVAFIIYGFMDGWKDDEYLDEGSH